jgi:hypothetical protein
MLLASLVEVSAQVAAAGGRLAKISLLAEALRSAEPAEVPVAVAYLSGELPQRQIGVGWATLRDRLGAGSADSASLTLAATDAALSAIGAVSGKGSTATRRELVAALFAVGLPLPSRSSSSG